MHRTRLLIVATGSDLRKSLEFALRAEGYTVTATDTIETTDPTAYDLIVLDLPATRCERLLDFAAQARRIVALADRTPEWLTGFHFDWVEKPILGSALIAAIRLALLAPGNLA